MIDQLPAGRGGVDAFGNRAEMDALVPEPHEQIGKVLYGATQAVELQDDEGVAAPDGLERLVEAGTARRRSM